jgi:hypothetical protein
MNSLTPLKVPRQLLVKKSRSTSQSQDEDETGGGACSKNQTDQEKTVLRNTASLIEVSGQSHDYSDEHLSQRRSLFRRKLQLGRNQETS